MKTCDMLIWRRVRKSPKADDRKLSEILLGARDVNAL